MRKDSTKKRMVLRSNLSFCFRSEMILVLKDFFQQLIGNKGEKTCAINEIILFFLNLGNVE